MKSIIDRFRNLFENPDAKSHPATDAPQQPYDFSGSESAAAGDAEKHLLMHSDIDDAAACRRILRRLEQQLCNSAAELRKGIRELGEDVNSIVSGATHCLETAEQGLAAAVRGREMSEVVCRLRGTLNGVLRDANFFQRGVGQTADSAADLDENSLATLAFQLIELDELLHASDHQIGRSRESLGRDVSRALNRVRQQLNLIEQLEHLSSALAAVQDCLRPFERAASPAAVQARLKKWSEELSQKCHCDDSRSHGAAFDSQAMSVVCCERTEQKRSF